MTALADRLRTAVAKHVEITTAAETAAREVYEGTTPPAKGPGT